MIVTIREDPVKMDFNTFKARIVALVGEIEKAGNRANTMFCGPDSEYDTLARTQKQLWRAKLEISGPMTEAEFKGLQDAVLKNESIQAKQGILRRK